MKQEHARFLTRLYPPAWRARYGEEFQTFLQSRRVPVLEVLNISGRALIEHVSEAWRAAVPLLGFAFLVIIASGFSLYLGVIKQPSLQLWLCWACLVGASAALIASPLKSAGPGPALLSVFRKLSVRLLFVLAALPFLIFFALRLGDWRAFTAVALIWVAQIWRGLARHLAASMSPRRREFTLVGTAMVACVGWGLLYHGNFEGHEIWVPLVFPFLVIVDTLWETRGMLVAKP